MKPGRPKLYRRPESQDCVICRNLRTDADGNQQCAAGRVLDPVNCPDFRDASRERADIGGVSGRFYGR